MTRYTDTAKAEAVALAALVGSKDAAKQLSIPRRSVSRWLQQMAEGDPKAPEIDQDTRTAVGDLLWRVVERGASRMETALADPDTRGSDVARIVDTAFRAHSLLTGGPTARTETTGSGALPSGLDEQWWEQFLGGPLTAADRHYIFDSMESCVIWAQVEVGGELLAARKEGREPRPIVMEIIQDGTGYGRQELTRRALRDTFDGEIERRELVDGRNGE